MAAEASAPTSAAQNAISEYLCHPHQQQCSAGQCSAGQCSACPCACACASIMQCCNRGASPSSRRALVRLSYRMACNLKVPHCMLKTASSWCERRAEAFQPMRVAGGRTCCCTASWAQHNCIVPSCQAGAALSQPAVTGRIVHCLLGTPFILAYAGQYFYCCCSHFSPQARCATEVSGSLTSKPHVSEQPCASCMACSAWHSNIMHGLQACMDKVIKSFCSFQVIWQAS